jgi:hypothetical protein
MTDQVPTPAPTPEGTPAAPAYAAQPAYAPTNTAPWNVLSIVSLVASLVGFGIVGIITGHISLGQIKRTGEQGRGLALAGTIIGYVAVAFGLIAIIVWVVVLAGIAASGSYSTY